MLELHLFYGMSYDITFNYLLTTMRDSFMYEHDFLFDELLVTDLTVDGKAVARHQGQVVFLDAGLPGDIVSARVDKTIKRIIHARVERVIHPSPHAVAPWCSHVNECGACSWQHFSLQAAGEWKHKHVRESLTRIGKIDAPVVLPLVPSPCLRAYRNKMSFAFASAPVSSQENPTLLGLRQFRDHAVVEVRECGLQPAVVMTMLEHVRRKVNSLGLAAWQGSGAGYLRFLVVHTPLHASQGPPQLLVECITGGNHRQVLPTGKADGRNGLSNADKVRELGTELMKEFSLTGFVHSERKTSSDVAQGERCIFKAGSNNYEECFGHITLRVPYNTFLQTNTAIAGLLYARVAEEAGLTGREVVWDLYSGVGAIALFLAGKAREMHGFEIQKEAVAAARANSATLGYTHCHFHQGALFPSVFSGVPAPDLIVADPPRAGLDNAVCEFLLTVPARRFIYISCDPGTQARDVNRLAPAWKMVHSQPYDMFPYTPHVENMVVLEKITR